jgi:hypothetical protein
MSHNKFITLLCLCKEALFKNLFLHYNLFWFKYYSYKTNCASRLNGDAKEEIIVGALEKLVDLMAQEAPGDGTMYVNNLLRCAVS